MSVSPTPQRVTPEIKESAEQLKKSTTRTADKLDSQSSDVIHATERKFHQIIDSGAIAASKAKKRWTGLKNSATSSIQEAKGAVKNAKSVTRTKIQSKPFHAISVAAGLGAVCALLLHRSKKFK